MSKPCEYCGVGLPLGVDKGTRRQRSFHFASCEKRPHSPNIEAQRDALLEALIGCRDRFFPVDQQERDRDVMWESVNAAIKAVEEGK